MGFEAQRALTAILSKYNQLSDAAPNDIQKRKIASAFYKEFCAAIPRGRAFGWMGEVSEIDDDAPDKGIQLELDIQTNNLVAGDLGIELSLGNAYRYWVSDDNTRPHSATIFPVGSPLYNTASTLRNGDTVVFSGTFVPFTSAQACYDTIGYATYFSLFKFSSIRKTRRTF